MIYSKKRHVLGIVICCLLLLGCTKEEDLEVEYTVQGSVIGSGAETNGVKVSFQNIDDPSLKYVAVTNKFGYFEFQNIVAGKYNMDASKESLTWGWYKDGNFTNQRDKIININENKDLIIYLKGSSSSYQFDLKISDKDGKPIENSFSIPKYSTTIAFRLYNPTNSRHSWRVSSGNCFVSDDIGYNLEFVFNSFSQTSGTLNPGEAILLVGTINQKIFSVYQRSPLYTYTTLSFHSDYGSKDVYLDIGF